MVWPKEGHYYFCGFSCTVDETIKINSFGTLRDRVGVAFDRILVYGTAGAAWISANDGVPVNGINVLGVSESKVGGAAGIGIEAGVSGGFSIRAEYPYMQVNGISTRFRCRSGWVAERSPKLRKFRTVSFE